MTSRAADFESKAGTDAAEKGVLLLFEFELCLRLRRRREVPGLARLREFMTFVVVDTACGEALLDALSDTRLDLGEESSRFFRAGESGRRLLGALSRG